MCSATVEGQAVHQSPSAIWINRQCIRSRLQVSSATPQRRSKDACAAISAAWAFVVQSRGKRNGWQLSDTASFVRAKVWFDQAEMEENGKVRRFDPVRVFFSDRADAPRLEVVFEGTTGKLLTIGLPLLEAVKP